MMADMPKPQLRGGKQKFESMEKVLCYEPDPNKVKIIYDAKILEVQTNLDERGRKQAEYLIHFQGWNSGWDRYVLEDLLLKDIPENRAQQEQLYIEAAELQKKVNKKKKVDRRASEISNKTIRNSLDSDIDSTIEKSVVVDNSEDEEIKFRKFQATDNSDAVSEADTDMQSEPSNSPIKQDNQEEGQIAPKVEVKQCDNLEEVSHEQIPLPLSEGIKRKLELDHDMVNVKKRLVRLPAQPNIVTLLEMFVRNYAITRLSQLEKQLVKSPYGQYKISGERELEMYEVAVNQITMCKEVAEGLRILTDCHLGKMLLYSEELEQFESSSSIRPHMENIERQVVGGDLLEPVVTPGGRTSRTSAGGRTRKPSTAVPDGDTDQSTGGKKRKSTSEVPGSVGSTSSGTATPTMTITTNAQYPQHARSHTILQQEVYSWKLVPESLYFEEPVTSSLVYGGIHLTRLVVKLPDLLSKMRFNIKSSKNIVKYLEFLVEFLTNQQDLFTDSNYL